MLGPTRSSTCLHKTFTKHPMSRLNADGRNIGQWLTGGEIALRLCSVLWTRPQHMPTSLLHSDDYHDRRPTAASVKAAKTARKLGGNSVVKPVSRLREASVPQGLLSNFRVDGGDNYRPSCSVSTTSSAPCPGARKTTPSVAAPWYGCYRVLCRYKGFYDLHDS
jgi:hypothetical protein